MDLQPSEHGSPVSHDERRTAPRIDGSRLRSNLGAVLDVSRTGMRVISRSVPEGEVTVHLGDGDSSIALRATVAWSRKVGLFKHMLGIEFVDPGDTVTRWLLTTEITARSIRVV